MRDPYSILGVPKNASPVSIKKEYRRLARESHPDLKPGDTRMENRFKEISGAYHILSNPAKRKKFDAGEIDANGNEKHRGPGFNTRPPGGATARGKSRFDQFFKDRQKNSSIKAKGANVTYTLHVPFVEAALGKSKTVRMANNKSLKISLPAATKEGDVLRLKGQGMKGFGGGNDGDALVEIKISPDPIFTRKEMDIFSEIPVGIDEAVLGGRIKAQTIHGIVSLKVPENSNSGTRLRLKGRGIKSKDGPKGDQYVTLKVMLPEKQDKSFVDFVRSWVEKNPYNARKTKISETAD